MRCSSGKCNTRYSIRSLDRLFYVDDRIGRHNSGMSIANILEIMHYFLHAQHLSVTEIREIIGNSHTTHAYWVSQCREVCVFVLGRDTKLVEAVQILCETSSSMWLLFAQVVRAMLGRAHFSHFTWCNAQSICIYLDNTYSINKWYHAYNCAT